MCSIDPLVLATKNVETSDRHLRGAPVQVNEGPETIGRGFRTKVGEKDGVDAETTVRLSMCLTTFNRAGFIGTTLESILSQLPQDCEVVIVDGASTDNTEQVVAEYERRFCNVRYCRQLVNHGIDRDYDRTVELARGEYCWLMTDDDLLKPDAIANVLSRLREGVSLILTNYQRLDVSMSRVVLSRCLDIDADMIYEPADADGLFVGTYPLLSYIGSVIIKRSIWMARVRDRYYDTLLMHIGVIFQEALPGETIVIADPLISYRDGNTRSFWPRMFEIFQVKLPAMVSSLAISDLAKSNFLAETRRTSTLFYFRAMGWYCLSDYRRWTLKNLAASKQKLVPLVIAIVPGIVVNALCLLIQRSSRSARFRDLRILHLRMSPYHFRNYMNWNVGTIRSVLRS